SSDLKDAPQPGSPPAAAAAAAPAPVKTSYYLQVASFHSQAQADKGARTWRLGGYSSTVRAWSSPGQATWYRVLLGPYPSPQAALAQARQLTNSGLIKFYVLTKIP
ncbi:MAG: SPOR domain-containing protein, partial [Desulfarculus sp.]